MDKYYGLPKSVYENIANREFNDGRTLFDHAIEIAQLVQSTVQGTYKPNADRYLWLKFECEKGPKRIWNHVLTEEVKAQGEDLDQVIDAAIEKGLR